MSATRRRLDDLKAAARNTPPRAALRRAPAPMRLEEVLGGCETSCAGRRCWFVETPFHQACARHAVTPEHFGGPLVCAGEGDRAAGGEPLVIEPQRTMVLDIETGGFAGMPVFLIGLVLLDRRPLHVVQLLARDYPEEEAILHGLAELAAARDTWVTFNGKSFDEPFVRDRATLHHVPLSPPRLHVDLLHGVRRHWREQLPNCRLGTVEEHILNRPRIGDVPSSDVPELFHHFIRTGNAGPLRPVLLHNQIDLVSCTELLVRLAQAP